MLRWGVIVKTLYFLAKYSRYSKWKAQILDTHRLGSDHSSAITSHVIPGKSFNSLRFSFFICGMEIIVSTALSCSGDEVKKLACSWFVNAGERQETSMPEKKNFIIHSVGWGWGGSHAHQNVCISFSCPQVPSSTGVTCTDTASGFALQLTNNNNLGEFTAIITSSEIAFCPRERCYLISQDCSLQTQP